MPIRRRTARHNEPSTLEVHTPELTVPQFINPTAPAPAESADSIPTPLTTTAQVSELITPPVADNTPADNTSPLIQHIQAGNYTPEELAQMWENEQTGVHTPVMPVENNAPTADSSATPATPPLSVAQDSTAPVEPVLPVPTLPQTATPADKATGTSVPTIPVLPDNSPRFDDIINPTAPAPADVNNTSDPTPRHKSYKRNNGNDTYNNEVAPLSALSIIAFVFSATGVMSIIGFILAIIAMVKQKGYTNNTTNRALNISAIVMSIVNALAFVILTIIAVVFFITASKTGIHVTTY